MPVYALRAWSGTPRALEHSAIAWQVPAKMHELAMIEADAELVERLKDFLSFPHKAAMTGHT